MNKNYELNSNVTKVSSIKEMLEIAEKEAGDKIAFEFKDEKNSENIVKITYSKFKKDTTDYV